MLAADPPNLAGASETAQRTIRDANRATEVLRRLRAMFSTKAPMIESADINDVAREVITLSAVELRRRGALLQTAFADDLPHVRVDRVQLQQVILNLLLNAADAMAEVNDRPRTVHVATGLREDGSVKLAVRDSGTGFDPQSAEKLFQAFYTTKPDGMGVGLSICRSIIESHKGRLWATPNDGQAQRSASRFRSRLNRRRVPSAMRFERGRIGWELGLGWNRSAAAPRGPGFVGGPIVARSTLFAEVSPTAAIHP
jgi:signal transduction histidine kinase